MSAAQYPMTFVRWQRDESRRCRVFNGPALDHLATTATCPLCLEELGTEPWQLIAVGPTDEEDQEKHDAGRWYSAAAVLGHAECVRDSSDDALDVLVSQLTPLAGDVR